MNEPIVTISDTTGITSALVSGKGIKGPTRVEVGDAIRIGDLMATLKHTQSNSNKAIPEVCLEILGPVSKGKVLRGASHKLVIGRSRLCDLQVDHPTVSRWHAILYYSRDEGGWVLEDRGSANGTAVGGVMITRSLLRGGETIRIGDVEMRFLGGHKTSSRRSYWQTILLLVLLAAGIVLLVLHLLGLLFN